MYQLAAPLSIVNGTLYCRGVLVGCNCSTVLPAHATKTFRVLRGASRYLYFLVIPLSPHNMSTIYASQTQKREYKKLVKYQSPSLVLNLEKSKGCQPQAQYLAKTFEKS